MSRGSGLPRWAGWAFLIVIEVGPIAASVGAGIFGTLLSMTPDVWGFLVGMLVCGVFALAIPLMKRAPEFKLLLHRAATSDEKATTLRHALEAMLQNTLVSIDANTNQNRVSLYHYHDGRFLMLARYSSNPELARDGRGVYPTGQGVIGQVWLEEFAVGSMPAAPERWNRIMVDRYGFGEEEAQGISMKARRIGGFTIRHQDRCVGVVMFESLDASGFQVPTLEAARDAITGSPLSVLVGRWGKLFPAVEAWDAAKVRRAPAMKRSPEPHWQQAVKATPPTPA